jgi:hypothetical protein
MKYFLTLLMTLLFAWLSLACDCIMTPIENHIKETKFIVTGQVLELLDTKEGGHYFQAFDSTRSYQVKIKILSSYKGGLGEGQIIEIGSDFSNCSFYFNKNGKYLLFLNKDKKANKYFQRTCSYSEKIENATEYLKTIEKQTKYR